MGILDGQHYNPDWTRLFSVFSFFNVRNSPCPKTGQLAPAQRSQRKANGSAVLREECPYRL